MSAQDLILGARVAHLRELKTEVEKLKQENAALRTEKEALEAHFALALIAAQELADARLELWDGWNLILGAKKSARDRDELFAQARAKLAEDPTLRIWIVFDGHDERVTNEERLRVSYTGGTGAHRADRFIVDFVRMAVYRGFGDRVTVRTNDKDFRRQIANLAHRTICTS